MRTNPGMTMRGAPQATRVLCPTAGCGAHVVTLPDGVRLAVRGVKTTSRLTGKCGKCDKQYDMSTTDVT